MSTIWFLILVSISPTGEVTSDLQFPNSDKQNSKEMCEYWGTRTTMELQLKLGNQYRTFWRCQEIETRDLSRAL